MGEPSSTTLPKSMSRSRLVKADTLKSFFQHLAEPPPLSPLHLAVALQSVTHARANKLSNSFYNATNEDPESAALVTGQGLVQEFENFNFYDRDSDGEPLNKRKRPDGLGFPLLHRRYSSSNPTTFRPAFYYELSMVAKVSRINQEYGTKYPFERLRRANEARERTTDTAKLAGGLLGPYTAAHCMSLDTFQRAHLRFLSEPSLTPETVDESAQVVAISYRHKPSDERTFDRDRMSDLEYSNWLEYTRVATEEGPVYFWQDQKAKGVRTDDDMDWIATGVFPYLTCPVVVLTSVHGAESDGERLWLSVERHLGTVNCGVTTVTENVVSAWDMRKGEVDLSRAERELAARVLHGCFEGKDTFHEEDRLKMIRWAVTKLISLSSESRKTFTDIGGEASISAAEMEELCVAVMRNTKETNGSAVGIRAREGSGVHAGWTDVVPVFETAPGNIPGAISVREDGETAVEALYVVVRNGAKEGYYVQIESGLGRGCIMTGELVEVEDKEFRNARVRKAVKVFTSDMILCISAIGLQMLLVYEDKSMPKRQRAAAGEKVYILEKYNLLARLTMKTLRAVWGFDPPEYEVHYIESKDARWIH